MRPQPKTPPPDVTKRNDLGLITETRRYKLITPLFGGGVEPGKADPITVVRATEVRGHLRFWWRATRGGQFNGDLSAMKAAEEAIWGSAAAEGRPGPSPVSVAISDAREGIIWQKEERSSRSGSRPVDLGDPSSSYSYVTFPLRSEQGKPAGSVRNDVEFTLTITYPEDQAAELNAALWAWETFGGIGARTRRGFGSLECVEKGGLAVVQPQARSMEQAINAGMKEHVGPGKWPDDVPHLIRMFKLVPGNGKDSADDAWKYLFDGLKKFRQARFPNQEGRSFGRSKWPEPDAIRDATETSAPKHSRRRLSFNKYPRAVFGLPIIFQFKDSGIGDPKQTSLEGAEHDRLASPLILRPLACADGKYVGLAAVLLTPTEPPKGLRLKGASGDPRVYAGLKSSEARQIEPLDGDTDVLQAFLSWL